jgi:hypothetical protein
MTWVFDSDTIGVRASKRERQRAFRLYDRRGALQGVVQCHKVSVWARRQISVDHSFPLPSLDFCGTDVFPSRVPSFFLDPGLLGPLAYCISRLFEGYGMAAKLVNQFNMKSERSMVCWEDRWYASDCRKYEFLRLFQLQYNLPNFSNDQVTHRGSSDTHFQPFILCASIRTASRLSMIWFIF